MINIAQKHFKLYLFSLQVGKTCGFINGNCFVPHETTVVLHYHDFVEEDT